MVENLGKPTSTLSNHGFVHDCLSSASMSGMPGIRVIANTIPTECTVEETIEKGVDDIFDDIIADLTKPLTEAEKSPKKEAEKTAGVIFEGNWADVNHFFYRRGWTDGLPVVPPTEEAVREMLTGTDLPPDHVVGKIVPMQGKATVEKIAVNAVMAGALPTYMPVLIAGVQALLDPRTFLEWHAISTGSWGPVWIINGPIRHDLNINSGVGLLSPGNIANAAIGRAMGLIIRNIGGVRTGMEDMGTFGNPCKYTTVVAEREEESPWEPFHVDYGFAKTDSTITVFNPNTSAQGGNATGNAKSVLAEIVYNVIPSRSGLTLYLIAPDTAKALVAGGLTKQEVTEYIYEYARVPSYRCPQLWLKHQSPTDVKPGSMGVASSNMYPPNPMETVRIFSDRECIKVIVAGGPHTGVHYFSGLKREENHDWVTKKIELPANWDKLVAKYKNLVPKYTLY